MADFVPLKLAGDPRRRTTNARRPAVAKAVEALPPVFERIGRNTNPIEIKAFTEQVRVLKTALEKRWRENGARRLETAKAAAVLANSEATTVLNYGLLVDLIGRTRTSPVIGAAVKQRLKHDLDTWVTVGTVDNDLEEQITRATSALPLDEETGATFGVVFETWRRAMVNSGWQTTPLFAIHDLHYRTEKDRDTTAEGQQILNGFTELEHEHEFIKDHAKTSYTTKSLADATSVKTKAMQADNVKDLFAYVKEMKAVHATVVQYHALAQEIEGFKLGSVDDYKNLTGDHKLENKTEAFFCPDIADGITLKRLEEYRDTIAEIARVAEAATESYKIVHAAMPSYERDAKILIQRLTRQFPSVSKVATIMKDLDALSVKAQHEAPKLAYENAMWAGRLSQLQLVGRDSWSRNLTNLFDARLEGLRTPNIHDENGMAVLEKFVVIVEDVNVHHAYLHGQGDAVYDALKETKTLAQYASAAKEYLTMKSDEDMHDVEQTPEEKARSKLESEKVAQTLLSDARIAAAQAAAAVQVQLDKIKSDADIKREEHKAALEGTAETRAEKVTAKTNERTLLHDAKIAAAEVEAKHKVEIAKIKAEAAEARQKATDAAQDEKNEAKVSEEKKAASYREAVALVKQGSVLRMVRNDGHQKERIAQFRSKVATNIAIANAGATKAGEARRMVTEDVRVAQEETERLHAQIEELHSFLLTSQAEVLEIKTARTAATQEMQALQDLREEEVDGRARDQAAYNEEVARLMHEASDAQALIAEHEANQQKAVSDAAWLAKLTETDQEERNRAEAEQQTTATRLQGELEQIRERESELTNDKRASDRQHEQDVALLEERQTMYDDALSAMAAREEVLKATAVTDSTELAKTRAELDDISQAHDTHDSTIRQLKHDSAQAEDRFKAQFAEYEGEIQDLKDAAEYLQRQQRDGTPEAGGEDHQLDEATDVLDELTHSLEAQVMELREQLAEAAHENEEMAKLRADYASSQTAKERAEEAFASLEEVNKGLAATAADYEASKRTVGVFPLRASSGLSGPRDLQDSGISYKGEHHETTGSRSAKRRLRDPETSEVFYEKLMQPDADSFETLYADDLDAHSGIREQSREPDNRADFFNSASGASRPLSPVYFDRAEMEQDYVPTNDAVEPDDTDSPDPV
jgi:hypothetical protein